MSRLIDADAFRRELDHNWLFSKEEQSKHGMADIAKSEVLFVLNQMPTIEERKKGKWIWNWDKFDYDTANDAVCSKCKNISAMPVGYFCKWCGADMRGTP